MWNQSHMNMNPTHLPPAGRGAGLPAAFRGRSPQWAPPTNRGWITTTLQPWQPPTNSKTPPPWSPDLAEVYPFRKYVKDLILWSAGCDLPEHQQGPAAVLQLAGSARALADEILVNEFIQGVTADWGDGQGVAAHPGLHLLIRRLGDRFNELEIEVVLRTMLDFMNFTRNNREDIDTALTRFDIVHSRAQDSAAINVSYSVLAYLLLKAMHIHFSRWPNLLLSWGGSFPTNGHNSVL